jgi:LL-diaminopimelate aminotransferase
VPAKLAQRVVNVPPYVFAGLEKRLAELAAAGKDIIRLDIGSPDQPPSPQIIESLYESAKDPTHHGYTGFFGIPPMRRAIADYYLRRFDVQLDIRTEVLPLIGSKEGIFNLAWTYVDSGDVVLVPDPGYPTYTGGTRLAGGEVCRVPLNEECGWLPDFHAIPEASLKRAKLLWLNYPNNPTTATASLEFFAQAVAFARRNDILLAHDNPYCDVCFDGYVAPSLLQVPGAKDVAIEFNSLSKSYNMGGWRVGMVVGNAEAIGALSRLKTNIDSGLFRAIQDAAVEALTGDQEWLSERNDVYAHRRDIVLKALPKVGMSADTPKGTIYVWAKIPSGYTIANGNRSDSFCNQLLDKAGVSITPGPAFGQQGEGSVRISLGQKTERITEAMERLRNL